MKLKKINFKSIKNERQESSKLRKNINTAVITIIFLLFALLYLIINIDPKIFWAKPLFFLILFLILFLFFTILFAKKRRGLISALVVCIFLLLRLLGQTSYYYLGGLIFIGLVIELLYIIKNR